MEKERHRGRSPDGGGVAATFRLDQIIARERHGILAPRQLDLEDHLVHVPEGDLAAGEIELPHAAEAVIVAGQPLDFLAVGQEAAAAVTQCRRGDTSEPTWPTRLTQSISRGKQAGSIGASS